MDSEQSDELVVALRRAARDLLAQRNINDLEQALSHIMNAAVDTVPGADAGGFTMAENGLVTSRNPTNADVRELDALQAQLDEGPCVSAVRDPADDGVVVAHDLAEASDAGRWPRFAPRAVERGYRSMMSTQMSSGRGIVAALNLYSRTPAAFDISARTVAGLFGVQAGLLLYGVNHAFQLSRAMDTRDLVGQAKGILMERFGVEADQAFAMLVNTSQDTNIKLTEISRWLAVGDGQPRPPGGGTLRLPPFESPR